MPSFACTAILIAPYEIMIILPILQMKKLRLRKGSEKKKKKKEREVSTQVTEDSYPGPGSTV